MEALKKLCQRLGLPCPEQPPGEAEATVCYYFLWLLPIFEKAMKEPKALHWAIDLYRTWAETGHMPKLELWEDADLTLEDFQKQEDSDSQRYKIYQLARTAVRGQIWATGEDLGEVVTVTEALAEGWRSNSGGEVVPWQEQAKMLASIMKEPPKRLVNVPVDF
jgi:hypothetical protein